MSEEIVRRECLFRGRVQGVGFRYTTRDLASQFRVVGYVMNLPDGRVRLVVEGERAELDRFVGALASEMARHIVDCETSDSPATNEYIDFSIRH